MLLFSISTFIGRLHPVVVHLPIGFLLLGALFALASRRSSFAALKPAAAPAFAAGTLAAVVAIITGYIRSRAGDYDEDLLATHQWMAYITTIVSALAWLLARPRQSERVSKTRWLTPVISLVVVLLVSFTGHLGGSLTHGEDYLTMDADPQPVTSRTQDINQAMVFKDLVQPILDDKCGTCHGSTRKKGKLSFANYALLLKGGKHGEVVKAGNAGESELMKRVSLPPTDKKFMPADDKPPLTAAEYRILHWWVQSAFAKQDVKLASLPIPDSLRSEIAALFKATDTTDNSAAAEDAIQQRFAGRSLKTIDAAAIASLKAKGFAARLIHYSPDLLDIRLLPGSDSVRATVGERLSMLTPFKDQVVWLNADGIGMTDTDVRLLNMFPNLLRLNIGNNRITDQGLAALQGMDQLQSLNLIGTMISDAALDRLPFRTLQSVYAWRTSVKATDSLARAGRPYKVITESK